jgi:hypothetical protein
VSLAAPNYSKKGTSLSGEYLGFVGQGVLILLKMTKNVIGLIGSVNYLTPSKGEL